jgi:S-adenosylmethionine/arginine decarboxylase-like enzyme
VVIAESHVTIHTWPEQSYAAVDIFTCGETVQAQVIQSEIRRGLRSKNNSSQPLATGLLPGYRFDSHKKAEFNVLSEG